MKNKNLIYVIGGGGHAKVVIATLRDAGFEVGGILDDAPELWGKSFAGIEIAGPIEKITELDQPGAVIAIGSNRIRRTVAEKLDGINWQTVIHPTAYVAGNAEIGAGSVVFAQAAIQPGAKIGAHCIINTSASVDHDCRIGDYVHLAPGTHLAGGVEVGRETFIGIGAVTTQYNKIGIQAIIGAGAVVIGNIPDGVTAVGVPAKVKKSNK